MSDDGTDMFDDKPIVRSMPDVYDVDGGGPRPIPKPYLDLGVELTFVAAKCYDQVHDAIVSALSRLHVAQYVHNPDKCKFKVYVHTPVTYARFSVQVWASRYGEYAVDIVHGCGDRLPEIQFLEFFRDENEQYTPEMFDHMFGRRLGNSTQRGSATVRIPDIFLLMLNQSDRDVLESTQTLSKLCSNSLQVCITLSDHEPLLSALVSLTLASTRSVDVRTAASILLVMLVQKSKNTGTLKAVLDRAKIPCAQSEDWDAGLLTNNCKFLFDCLVNSQHETT